MAIYFVDRSGRRKLLLQGGAQMFIAQVAVGVLLGVAFGQYNTSNLPTSITYIALVLICIFVAGFAWSWGERVGWARLRGSCATWPLAAAAGRAPCSAAHRRRRLIASTCAGPLCWLVTSELQPLDTRSAGFSITVFNNFLW